MAEDKDKDPTQLTFRSKRRMFEESDSGEGKKTGSRFLSSKKTALRKAFGNYAYNNNQEVKESPKQTASNNNTSDTPPSSFLLKTKNRTAEALTSPPRFRPQDTQGEGKKKFVNHCLNDIFFSFIR